MVKFSLKRPREFGFNSEKLDFSDCSDHKRANRFQSGRVKIQMLAASLDATSSCVESFSTPELNDSSGCEGNKFPRSCFESIRATLQSLTSGSGDANR